MTLQRVITEFGTGNDLHGGDYTKAAVRAVQDAIHHSSLTLIRSLGVDAKTMQVEVTIGVQQPARVELAEVKAALPHGEVTVKAVVGPRVPIVLWKAFISTWMSRIIWSATASGETRPTRSG